MNIAEQLFTETKVALATRSLSLSVEKLNATGFSINEGCNWYDVSMAVIEVGPQLHSLIAVPLSGKERAFLDPPDQVVLNFWDITLESTHRQVANDDKKLVLTLTDKSKYTRWVFDFNDGVEFTTCMQLFFITRRLVLLRDSIINRLQHDALSRIAPGERYDAPA